MSLDQARTPSQPVHRRSWFGGVPGNERLTAEMGAVLLVLLAGLGLTIPMVRSLIYEHVFIGMLLIPPVVVKLASTGYRFVRYYAGDPAYRLAGPPARLQRVIAPLVVASTVAVFGTGVMLLVLGPSAGIWRNLHKVAFIAWFAVTAVHVLSYLGRVPRLALPDWRREDPRLGGSQPRRLLVAGAVVLGVVLASTTVHYAHAWANVH
jgi:hypothetical protein